MDLNQDVVIEILLHLPAKSALRSRSVCKCWCNIIDSSAFRKSHFHNQSKNDNVDDDVLFLQLYMDDPLHMCDMTIILPQDNWKSFNGIPSFQKVLNDYKNGKPLKIAGPLNGLICVYEDYPHSHTEKNSSVAICNPCLGESTILPISPFCSSLMSSKPRTNAFCSRDMGFVFDHITKDYKIVQLLLFNSGIHVEVYSGTTNTWTKLVTDFFDKDGWKWHELRSIKSWSKKRGSTVHWQTKRHRWRRGVYEVDYVILSFDVHSEVFETIVLPKLGGGTKYKVFANDDDSFLLFAATRDENGLTSGMMGVWELDRGRKWTHVRDVNILFGWRELPKACWKDGVVMKRLYYLHDKKYEDLIFYDYTTGKERKCVDLPEDRIGSHRLEILEYKCSLNSLVNCLSRGTSGT